MLLRNTGFVKTVNFKNPKYLGDPRNIVKIFNEKEVDELIILDIGATSENRNIQCDIIHEIVSEAFMPVAYGGGVNSLEQARAILGLGVEKIVIGTQAIENSTMLRQIIDVLGSQSVVVCLDVKKNLWGKYEIFTHGGKKNTKLDPTNVAMSMEKAGVGELVVNSIDRDGTMMAYDVDLVKMLSKSVGIPVIACGGAGKTEDLAEVIVDGGASAAAAGSLFVFQGKYKAVLISYPERSEILRLLSERRGFTKEVKNG